MHRSRLIRAPIALLCLLSFAAPYSSADAPTSQPSAQLTIKVTDLRNHKGQLIFGVFAAAEGFPTIREKSVNWQIKAADADSVTFIVNLSPGKYAASVLHDEKSNGKMD